MTDNSLQQINEIFRRLKEKGIPTQSLMQKIAGHLEENIHENLRTEGTGSPIPWAPLSPEYAKQKSKKKSLVQKILTSSGALDQSIFQRATELEAAAGTNKIYAAAHQLGAEIYLPARSEIFKRNKDKKGRFKKLGYERKVEQGFTFKERILRIPARPFLYLTDHYKNLILRDVSTFYSHL